MIYLKHPTQGFIKAIKESATPVIKQLETHGWFRCKGLKDATPYSEAKADKKSSKKSSKKKK